MNNSIDYCSKCKIEHGHGQGKNIRTINLK